jgi:predicted dehydrogenase
MEKMIGEVDAVLLGDDLGDGKNHLDLLAQALVEGLPTFCDKPLADTPARARQRIAPAQKHKASLISSSLLRHIAEVREMARLWKSGEAGPLRWLTVGYGAAARTTSRAFMASIPFGPWPAFVAWASTRSVWYATRARAC